MAHGTVDGYLLLTGQRRQSFWSCEISIKCEKMKKEAESWVPIDPWINRAVSRESTFPLCDPLLKWPQSGFLATEIQQV